MFKKFVAAFAALLTASAFAAVDVNKATQAELEAVKGIGPVTSTLILSERKKGKFKDWDDFVSRTKGVGDKSAEKFSESGLTVNGAAFKPAAMKPEPSMPAKAASSTRAVASKAASAVRAGASAVKENAEEEVAAGKANVQEARDRRAAKKAAEAASTPMKK